MWNQAAIDFRCIYTSPCPPLKGGEKMSLFGFDMRPISRLQGGSIVKTASYILRENLHDEYQQKTHYYSHIKDLLHSEILLPENAPEEFHDLQTLLAAIDQAEKRYDARTGRSLRLSLPNDVNLSTGDRISLARDYIREVFVAQGVCAILAIHERYRPRTDPPPWPGGYGS